MIVNDLLFGEPIYDENNNWIEAQKLYIKYDEKTGEKSEEIYVLERIIEYY